MTFVFSIWYIVALVLVAGIVASLIIFFKMDKKDAVLIKEFVDSNSQEETATNDENNKE